jgi:hypothetical protein
VQIPRERQLHSSKPTAAAPNQPSLRCQERTPAGFVSPLRCSCHSASNVYPKESSRRPAEEHS